MENRTMAKIQVGGSGVSVRTVSRSFKSLRSIFIEKERLWELQEKGRCTVRDGLSTADMSRHGLSSGEDCIKVFFIWLEGTGEGDIKGCTEQICLPYGKFFEHVAACMQDGKERRGKQDRPEEVRQVPGQEAGPSAVQEDCPVG